MSMIVLEPLTVAATRYVTYTLSDHHDGSPGADETLQREEDFAARGARQDRDVQLAIQANLASNPYGQVTFGLFEGAISHFHRQLAAALDGGDDA